jgi:hypothetical protein
MLSEILLRVDAKRANFKPVTPVKKLEAGRILGHLNALSFALHLRGTARLGWRALAPTSSSSAHRQLARGPSAPGRARASPELRVHDLG